MDPEIFRTYFIRLHRSITQMEKQFFEMLQPAEKDTFVRYSNSLKDLARHFKVIRDKTDLGYD